jgi:hypothetical protein
MPCSGEAALCKDGVYAAVQIVALAGVLCVCVCGGGESLRFKMLAAIAAGHVLHVGPTCP